MTGRDRVALILATSTGLAVLVLVVAVVFDVRSDPSQAILSEALITGTLGVLVGGLVGYIGARGPTEPTATLDEHATQAIDVVSPAPSIPRDGSGSCLSDPGT